MFSWYRNGTQQERRTFWACYSGWALDAFDVQIFSLAIPTFLFAFNISKTGAGLIASITLVSGALGGWLGGALSDRVGRVRALQITVTVFSAATFACAFAQNAAQLALLKTLQGLGFGAEWAAGAVLMAETIRPEHRGKAGGAVQSGWALGWGSAVAAFGLFYSYLDQHLAWRALFAVGVIPALFVLYLRRNLSALESKEASPDRTPFFGSLLGIFSARNVRATLVGGLLGFGAHGGYYGLFTWLPTYLKEERHFSVLTTSSYLAVIVVAFGVGCLVAGQLLDRLGRRRTVAGFAVGCITVTILYLLAPIGDAMMLVLGFPLGFFAAGIPASMGALFNELFPADVRGSGVGFCYNAGRVFAAFLPALIGSMSERWTLATAIGVDASLAYSLVIVAILLLPERTGVALDSVDAKQT